MMRARRGILPLAAAGAAVAMIAGCSSAAPTPGTAGDATASPFGTTVLGDEQTRPLVEALPEAAGVDLPLERLDESLVPPTNRWFSGLVLGAEPQPVFPLPLSFSLVDGGVAFGVPEVTAAPGAVSAPHTPTITLDAGADAAVAARYDEVSVTLALRDGRRERAEVTIARGSPVVSYTALAEHEVRLGAQVEPAPDAGEGVHVVTTPTATFALVAPEASVSDDGATLTLPKGASANWVAVPEGGDLAALAALAEAPLERVDVAAALEGESATTTLEYRTAGDAPTVVGRLPHQSEGGADCALGAFPTAYGELALCEGPTLSWAVPAVEAAGALALEPGTLSEVERSELVDALEQDVTATAETPPDTYFGGKALARLASMLQLARQLAAGEGSGAGGGSGDAAARAADIALGLEQRLAAELAEWAEPAGCDERDARCFTYDDTLRGVVGREPSFGSDEFNDHHFHYGYFLYAGAVLAGAGAPGGEVDGEIVDRLRPVLDLLAADLASSGGELFPASRAFDPYSGHSWASGAAPFADGNNQESSSEAVNAANGLALWAQATGDAALADQAQWMLSAESHSARSYWTGFDRGTEPYAGYERGSVGIVWDAKRDFGTWFSPEPSAVLGIQLLPMPPVTEHLLGGEGGEQRILDNIAEVAPDGAETAPLFAESLLMYRSLAGPAEAEAALEAARALPPAKIDAGIARSYLLAFILSQR